MILIGEHSIISAVSIGSVYMCACHVHACHACLQVFMIVCGSVRLPIDAAINGLMSSLPKSCHRNKCIYSSMALDVSV